MERECYSQLEFFIEQAKLEQEEEDIMSDVDLSQDPTLLEYQSILEFFMDHDLIMDAQKRYRNFQNFINASVDFVKSYKIMN